MPVPPCRKARVPLGPKTTLNSSLGDYFKSDPGPPKRLLKTAHPPERKEHKFPVKGKGPQKEVIRTLPNRSQKKEPPLPAPRPSGKAHVPEWTSGYVATIDDVIQRKGRVRDAQGRRRIEARSTEWDFHSMYGQTRKFMGDKLPTYSQGIFPGTNGWGPDYDGSGKPIDYASCEYGGPFGKRPVRNTFIPTSVPPELQRRGILKRGGASKYYSTKLSLQQNQGSTLRSSGGPASTLSSSASVPTLRSTLGTTHGAYQFGSTRLPDVGRATMSSTLGHSQSQHFSKDAKIAALRAEVAQLKASLNQ